MQIDGCQWFHWYWHLPATERGENKMIVRGKAVFQRTRFRSMISLPVWTHKCNGVNWLASWTRVFTFTWRGRRKSTLSISAFWTAIWRKFRPLLSIWNQERVRWWSSDSCSSRVSHLFSCSWFTFQYQICCFIIFCRHSTSKRCLILLVAYR